MKHNCSGISRHLQRRRDHRTTHRLVSKTANRTNCCNAISNRPAARSSEKLDKLRQGKLRRDLSELLSRPAVSLNQTRSGDATGEPHEKSNWKHSARPSNTLSDKHSLHYILSKCATMHRVHAHAPVLGLRCPDHPLSHSCLQ